MSNGFPSMTALLGLLAVAGYQNRDKLADLLNGRTAGAGNGNGMPGAGGSFGRSAEAGGTQGGLGGLLDGLRGGGSSGGGGLLGGGAGGLLGGGIGELIENFRRNGHGEAADSWVGTGENRSLQPQELESAIGPDVVAHLSRQTGLSRDELLSRLSRDLPRAVDDHTPEGRLPSAAI